MSIPRQLFQAWVGPKPIPDRERAWCVRMCGMNPTWKVTLFGNELLERYGQDPYVKALIEQGEAWAFITDRLRVLLLRDQGGVWLDPDCEPKKPLDTLPIWDAAHVQFAAGMRSPHRKDVALYRGVALVDNTFLASAPNGTMIRRLDALWRPEAPVVTGHRCGIAIMENVDQNTVLVNHRYFYGEQVYPESIVQHDSTNLASWITHRTNAKTH